MQLLRVFFRFERDLVRVDLLDVGEFRVVEPPRDLEAGEVRHASSAEASDELRADFLAADALTGDGALDHGMQLRLADTGEAPFLGVLGYFFAGVLGDVADVEDHSEVDGAGFQAFGMAVVGEGVLECVAGGVVALASRAGDAGAGGEEDKEVEVCGEGRVQVPASLDFGVDGAEVLVVGHVLVDCILCTSV